MNDLSKSTLTHTGKGTPTILSRALAVADDPGSADDETLVSTAGDLSAWGAFDAAEILHAEAAQRGLGEAVEIRREIDEARRGVRRFDERYLVKAIETTTDPAANIEGLALAADTLMRWGALNEAETAIARIATDPGSKAQAAAMAMAVRQLRRSGVFEAFKADGHPEAESLNRPHEVLVARGSETADRAIVVFTGVERRFWMSLQVLYHYLRKLNAHVIYLNDMSNTLFLNGLGSVGGGYAGLVSRISALAGELGVSRLHVLASSAGGYVGARAAADLEADTFLGLSIRTELKPNTRLPLLPIERSAMERCKDRHLLGSLREYLSTRTSPRMVTLLCGDGSKSDLPHAHNMQGVPRVNVGYVSEYSEHNVVPGLIARGQFEDILRQYLVPAETDARA